MAEPKIRFKMHIHQIIIQKWLGSLKINRKIPQIKWFSPLEYHKIFTENHSNVRTQTRENIEMVSIFYWRKNFLSFSLVQLFPNRILKYLRIIENWIHRKISNLRSFRLLLLDLLTAQIDTSISKQEKLTASTHTYTPTPGPIVYVYIQYMALFFPRLFVLSLIRLYS